MATGSSLSANGTQTNLRVIVEISDRVKVRTWQQSDITSSARHLNSKQVWDNLRNRIPHPYKEFDAAWWIGECEKQTNHVSSGTWTPAAGSEGPLLPTDYAIVIDDEAVGGIGLQFEQDVYIRTAELGYWLGHGHWGKGVMSQVVPAFVQWAWETFGILIRINASTYEWNAASGKVLQKAEFEYEGRQRDAFVKNGSIGAMLMWGALRPK